MDFLRKYNDQPDDINVLSKTIVDCLFKVHSALGPGYLERMSGLRMGFLVNFNVPLIREGIKRFVPKELRSFGPSLETNER
jgi:hypothetical protein